MNADLTVHHPDLDNHARRVAAISDRVQSTASAGHAMRPGPEAYGKLCSLVPTMLNALQDVLVGGIASQAGSLADTAARLRETADGYAAADDRRAGAFGAIGSS